MLLRFGIGLLLLGHGVMHFGYIAPPPEDPDYPFVLESSWLFPEQLARGLGLTLAAIALVTFTGLALTAWGLRVLYPAWRALIGLGTIASLAVIAGFWHPWLVVGIVIDGGLFALTFAVPDWWERAFP